MSDRCLIYIDIDINIDVDIDRDIDVPCLHVPFHQKVSLLGCLGWRNMKRIIQQHTEFDNTTYSETYSRSYVRMIDMQRSHNI